MLAASARWFKDILFPVSCVDCGVEGEWWCKLCRAKHQNECALWPADAHLDRGASFFVYEENGPVGRLIKQFKYGFAKDIKNVFEKIISEKKGFLRSLCSVGTIISVAGSIVPDLVGAVEPICWSVLPVPLHPRRERERGFNQAKVLAKIFLDSLNTPPCIPPPETSSGQALKGEGLTQNPPPIRGRIEEGVLVRTRYTPHQARLSKEERTQNVAGAFAWKGPAPAPAYVLLVDDVYTTGATMQECARVLKAAGAQKIYWLTLARG
ncbi:ComF family protein [Patescibacteria group bacterium]|nr:MAG: ComF family protein [Patescibacteria group bacterium]